MPYAIRDKVFAGIRITEEDALRMFESDDLFTLGALASHVAEKKNGRKAFFIRNRHINIQASWVTQGLKFAQVALRFGANDFGSTMIEENVVASTGVSYAVSMQDIINAIRTAGFVPAQRDTLYNLLRVY